MKIVELLKELKKYEESNIFKENVIEFIFRYGSNDIKLPLRQTSMDVDSDGILVLSELPCFVNDLNLSTSIRFLIEYVNLQDEMINLDTSEINKSFLEDEKSEDEKFKLCKINRIKSPKINKSNILIDIELVPYWCEKNHKRNQEGAYCSECGGKIKEENLS